MRRNHRRRRPLSLRARLLAGSLIPGGLLLIASTTVSAIEVVESTQRQAESAEFEQTTGLALPFYPLLNAERGASLLFQAQPTPENRRLLAESRAAVDDAGQQLQSTAAALDAANPVVEQLTLFNQTLQTLAATRAPIDAGTLSLVDINETYRPLFDNSYLGTYTVSTQVTSAEVGNQLGRAANVMRVGDMIGRMGALAGSALQSGGLAPEVHAEVVRAAVVYGDLLAGITPLLPQRTQDELAALRGTTQWQQLQTATDALLSTDPVADDPDTAERAGPQPAVDPVLLAEISRQVSDQLLRLGLLDTQEAWQLDVANADGEVRAALTRAIVVFLCLLLALVIAAAVTTQLVGRLARLRRQTLALADGTLADVVQRLQRGEPVDTEADLPMLEHGDDELGEVAKAFNHAQRAAVRATVDEAHTRAGFNRAFLNIARRSQNLLHQQMEMLDRIQRTESNPDQLDLLFRLDHLVTRERRNAENLVILGGEQPRRQWRNPVTLSEVVRGAVGEAEHYQRVTVHPVSDSTVVGPVVGDVVHLLAELVDNATAFSPPEAPIEIRGRLVGRGVVVEIEDQGLGIEAERLDELNRTLREPPDFSLFTLSEDARIGLFVVAWLARKHAITVNLRQSVYGGVLAGVLIPAAILARSESVPAMRGATSTSAAGADAPERPRRRRPRPDDIPVFPLDVTDPAGAAIQTGRNTWSDAGPGLPELPQRHRQTHMDPRLLDQPAGTAPDTGVPMGQSPDAARSQMSALQRGSAQARREWQAQAHDSTNGAT